MATKSESQMYQYSKFKALQYMVTPFDAVSRCIDRLEDWPDMWSELTTEFCPDLTYEEVLGALLLARDALRKA